MKTLDEALDKICPATGKRTGMVHLVFPEDCGKKASLAPVLRYNSIGEECHRNRKVQRICRRFVKAAAEGDIDSDTMAFSLFMTGLMVGMEMEKAE